MNYEAQGKIVEIFPLRTIGEKGFAVREFAIENNDSPDYPEMVKFQCSGAKTGLLDKAKIGDKVKISFNLKGRRYEKAGVVNYFNTLDCWKLEITSAGNSVQNSEPEGYGYNDNGQSDDQLPF